MNSSLLFALLLSCFLINLTFARYSDDYEAYLKKFERNYGAVEKALRSKIFESNLIRIREHNLKYESREVTWKMGLTAFADWSWEEFSQKRLGVSDPQSCSATDGEKTILTRDYPESVDWRLQGIVTHVKDQGNCGSCWTFSTTGCLESHHAQATGNLVSLSEQNLIDCAGDYNNYGCNGGLPSQAFEYIRFNGGIDLESVYPYEGVDNDCRYNSSASAVGATVKDVYNITTYDENGILNAVANVGPVSIAFEVINGFSLYTGGVYSADNCGTTTDDVNHAVLAVGYGTDWITGVPYWTVKNSWGADWGIDGYFYIERGVNMCALAACASYPIV